MRNLMLLLILVGAGMSVHANDERHERGREIYNYRCYFCHGYSGDAKTLATTFLNTRPTAFVDISPDEVDRGAMLEVLAHGRPGTGMVSFSRLLDAADREIVIDFVINEFIVNGQPNTRYHTLANGWPDHDRYAAAFPFATGKIPIDEKVDNLSLRQRAGKALFMRACVSCHDRANVRQEGPVWSSQSTSYPRNGYDHRREPADAWTSASTYAIHDKAPDVALHDPRARHGRDLWEVHCAFCHAMDGTGKNWIGSFMEPKPRDLTDPQFMAQVSRSFLETRIRQGIPDTSMPAWDDVLNEAEIEAIITYIFTAFYPTEAVKTAAWFPDFEKIDPEHSGK